MDKRCAVLTLEMIDALVGLNNECTVTKPKPDLILEIDGESENKELVEDFEQAVDVIKLLIDESQ